MNAFENLPPEHLHAVRRALAAEKVVAAKRHEFEAYAFFGDEKSLEEARFAVHSAVDAHLDALAAIVYVSIGRP